MNADALRTGLDWVLRITDGERNPPPAAWWGGDASEERRVRDDLDSGRLYWRKAHARARRGLEALERGGLEEANVLLHAAKTFCIEALLKRVHPAERARLIRPAKKRGRLKKD